MGKRKKTQSDSESVEIKDLAKGDVVLMRGDWRTIKGFEPYDGKESYLWIHFTDGVKAARSRYETCQRKKGETE